MGNDPEVRDIDYVPAANPSEQKLSPTIVQSLRLQLFALWALLGLDLPTVLMMLKLVLKIYPHSRKSRTDHGTDFFYTYTIVDIKRLP
jgi:hypothetical protein